MIYVYVMKNNKSNVDTLRGVGVGVLPFTDVDSNYSQI